MYDLSEPEKVIHCWPLLFQHLPEKFKIYYISPYCNAHKDKRDFVFLSTVSQYEYEVVAHAQELLTTYAPRIWEVWLL